ncbi:hypothetical protein [Peterkaempfera sp. SMS 1(5)a]|uniref:hypothetical protein n=1 Tax=Peterkaempfera podocarpi TaxID=3232308 RepID=UPI00366E1D88
MDVEVNAAGPLFTGTASAMVTRWTAAAGEELAQWADDEVHRVLGQVLQHPTGYYESQVRVDRQGPDRFAITDGGVVYGPWLEGIGSRNYPTTRFKGYSTFRRVKQRVEARADRTFRAAIKAREL